MHLVSEKADVGPELWFAHFNQPPSSPKNSEINKNINIIKNKKYIETKISGLTKHDIRNLVSMIAGPYHVMNS